MEQKRIVDLVVRARAVKPHNRHFLRPGCGIRPAYFHRVRFERVQYRVHHVVAKRGVQVDSRRLSSIGQRLHHGIAGYAVYFGVGGYLMCKHAHSGISLVQIVERAQHALVGHHLHNSVEIGHHLIHGIDDL
ncbi:MAG: hypothetical protein BWY57_02552 [Betaproteobacteria bacterium ADurb.Bin341]|nr:MAG: hypothetical protein BWY57_02552 [Betaproteobacteria bacterium ADurb.Bin341]